MFLVNSVCPFPFTLDSFFSEHRSDAIRQKIAVSKVVADVEVESVCDRLVTAHCSAIGYHKVGDRLELFGYNLKLACA